MIKEYNHDAGVDFELASSPMTPGKPIDVELRSITTTGKDGTKYPGTIAVYQDGKYISNLDIVSKKKLLDTVPGGVLEEGQVVKAQIVKKLTTASGNLANVVGLRSSLLMFQDRSTSKVFLPEGKVFVGSVKDLGESVTFYSLDGKNSTTYSKDECKDLTPGVSYMLLKNPNGK